MLSFDDDAPAAALPSRAPRTPETIRAHALGNIGGGILSREPVHDIDVDKEAAPENFHRVRVEDKRVINGSADVNQLDPYRATTTQDKPLTSWIYNGLVRFKPGSASLETLEHVVARHEQTLIDVVPLVNRRE